MNVDRVNCGQSGLCDGLDYIHNSAISSSLRQRSEVLVFKYCFLYLTMDYAGELKVSVTFIMNARFH